MNILVVGGAGYIGSHCVRELLRCGMEPIVLDNLCNGHREALNPRVLLYIGDYGDASLVSSILSKHSIDVVMHFGAFCYVGESATNPLKYYENNVVKTITLISTLHRAGVRRLVFSSSCATYGSVNLLPIREETPQSPINVYGQTKYDIERFLLHLSITSSFSFAAMRYFNAAGAASDGSIGEDHSPETHLIPLALKAAQDQSSIITIFGDDYETRDGTCERDYVHVEDICRAHVMVIPRLNAPSVSEFYNLGTGKPTSVKRVLEVVEKVTGRPVSKLVAPRRVGDPACLYADATKATTVLGWRPHYGGIEETIATAWHWHKEHPYGFAGKPN